MYAFYACIKNLPNHFAYSGSFIYREGFDSIGDMLTNVATLVAKLVAAARVGMDFAVIGRDTNNAKVWPQIIAAIAKLLNDQGSDLQVDRVNILDYKHDPKICKVLTPAYPSAVLDSK